MFTINPSIECYSYRSMLSYFLNKKLKTYFNILYVYPNIYYFWGSLYLLGDSCYCFVSFSFNWKDSQQNILSVFFIERHFYFAFVFLIAAYNILGWQFFVPALCVCCPTPFGFPDL